MPDVITVDLVALDAAATAARDLFLTSLRARYPVGATVSWVYGNLGDVQHGQVVSHSWGDGDRVEVRNTDSDAVYWVHAWRIVAALKAERES